MDRLAYLGGLNKMGRQQQLREARVATRAAKKNPPCTPGEAPHLTGPEGALGQSEVPLSAPHAHASKDYCSCGSQRGPAPSFAAHHSSLPPVILLALSSSSKFIMLSMTTYSQGDGQHTWRAASMV